MTTTSTTNNNNNKQDRRKQALEDKVTELSKTVHEINPHNREEALAAFERILYLVNIRALKEFLVDREGKGKKPELIVASPYTPPETGIPEDRVYLPKPTEYHQETLDMLKKQQLVEQDATVEDYDFLFSMILWM